MRRNISELIKNNSLGKGTTPVYNLTDTKLISEAYSYTRSRTPNYLTTSFNVAQLLIEQKADAIIVVCALIAQLFWENSISLDDIKTNFGEGVSDLLSHFSLPPSCRKDTEDHYHQDTQFLLSTLSKNINETLLLLAFKVIALEQNQESNTRQYVKDTEEALEILAPIASRLNLNKLRRRLEDAAFKILKQNVYTKLEGQVSAILDEDKECLEIFRQAVKRLLDKHHIKAVIQGRIKSLYSIHCKMTRSGKLLSEIMDRAGLRIIVTTVPQCYNVLGLLHTHFQPVPAAFDDYIGLPKDNGYQSIHTCVYPIRNISHKTIEFQIRIELMHKEAEYGVAAHWLYKKKDKSARDGDKRKTLWLKGLAKQHLSTNSKDFIQLLYNQVYEDDMVVFGQAGHIMRIPKNATVAHYFKKSNFSVAPNVTIKVNGQPVDKEHLLHDVGLH